MHVEYPKKMHHMSGERQRVMSADEQEKLEADGGWGEAPAGPFSPKDTSPAATEKRGRGRPRKPVDPKDLDEEAALAYQLSLDSDGVEE